MIRWRSNLPVLRSAALAIALLPSLAGATSVTMTGTIDYAGSLGPVSANQPIRLEIGKSRHHAYTAGSATVATDNGTFNFSVEVGSSYYLVYFLDLIGDSQLHVGDPMQFYNDRFFAQHADALAVRTDGVKNLKLRLDDAALVAGVVGRVTYTGSRGQPSMHIPIRVDAFTNPTLSGGRFDQETVSANGHGFEIISIVQQTTQLFLRAFLDLNGNGQLDGGEPFSIYLNKGDGSGDAVAVSPTRTNIDIRFGDDNIFVAPTPTTTATPTPSPTPSPTWSPSPLPSSAPGSCIGDCNGDGKLTVDELVKGVGIALGTDALSDCPRFDCGGGGVTVNCLVQAVGEELNGCPQQSPSPTVR